MERPTIKLLGRIGILILLLAFVGLYGITSDIFLTDFDDRVEDPERSAQIENGKYGFSGKIASLQIPFVENQGQVGDQRVKYYARTFGGTVLVTDGCALIYSFPYSEDQHSPQGCEDYLSKGNIISGGWVIKESLIGASALHVRGVEEAPTKVSYFKGKDPTNWRSEIPTYVSVDYGEIYDGVELKLKTHGNNIEKIFCVKPHVNPGVIRSKIEGALCLLLNEQGEIELETGLGIVKFTKPVAYQESHESRQYVEVDYLVKGEQYGFEVGSYDHSRELFIDPLLASTFLGGGDEIANDICIDDDGNFYIVGHTATENFPATPGAYDTTFNGYWDAFVSKLDGDLQNLLASTYIGGEGSEWGKSIALDNSGNVYITGKTESPEFPTTPTAFDTSYDHFDTYISKFDSELQTLLASTLLGGISEEVGYTILIDLDENVYVAGSTNSSEGFPTTPGAYQISHAGGGSDAFISKFNADLYSLLASTFLGGSEWGDIVYFMLMNDAGDICVAGGTSSQSFPTTPGAYSSYLSGYADGFVSRLDSNLTTLIASTLIGGSDYDEIWYMDFDEEENVYITGNTWSEDFPVSPDAFDTTYNGSSYYGGDNFVSQLDGDLTDLLASTYLGGVSDEGDEVSLCINDSGRIYIAGCTRSVDFPVTSGAFDTTKTAMDYDAYIAVFNDDLTNLEISTFLGGDETDKALGLIFDQDSNVITTGTTASDDFPVTPAAYDTSNLYGSIKAFITRLDSELSSQGTGVRGGNTPTVPKNITLYQNFPNPFNPLTTIRFDLPVAGWVKLEVFDISGRIVGAHGDAPLLNGWREAGLHEISFNGSNFPSGVYIARLEVGPFRAVRKLVLLK